MAFTTPGTSIFFDSVMDLQTVSTDAYYQSLPPEVQTFLTSAKIDLKTLPQTLGTDIGFLLDWPASALVPNALVAIEIKDRAQARSLIQSVLGAFGLPAAPVEENGASVYRFPGTQLVEPSLAVTDKFFLGSLTSAEMGRALSLKPGAPTLESAEVFKSVQADYRKAGIAFGFVDAKAVFERVYNMVRPMAVIAGSMSPQVTGVVDVQKLPETEVISSRLGPIVYSSERVSDGILLQSSGPITLTQGLFLVAGGAGASWAAQMAMP
jgi:hypothetical protein